MRLNEIMRVDPAAKTFDTIKGRISQGIYDLYEYIEEFSDNFNRSAAESFGRDEIGDFLNELSEFNKVTPFLNTDQVSEMVHALHKYLSE
jgi:hypothetical protein